MANLLEETIEKLKEFGKTPNDVEWVGDEEGYSDWDNFTHIANFEYKDGFGGTEIVLSLKVVGKDWWLERHEYDGSEWWEFKTIPQKTIKKKIISVKDEDYEDKITFEKV